MDLETSHFSSEVARIADMIISIQPVPMNPTLQVFQAKGRGLRVPPPQPRLELTYKRRRQRQTRKAFPFSVIVKHEPKGFSADAKDWCIEILGDRNWDTGWISNASGYGYFFKQKSHAVMFVLAFKGWQAP
jgi:hypothetical protein